MYFVVQRNVYVCLMERYFIFCKNDFDLSNIFDPAQSKAVKTKVSDPAKNAKKPIIYCVLVKIFLRTNLIYKDFCLACNFGIPREKKIMMMFGFAVLVKSWIQHWNCIQIQTYNYLHIYILNSHLKDYHQNSLTLWNKFEWINN